MIAALTRDAPADSLPIMVEMPMVWACPLVLTLVAPASNVPLDPYQEWKGRPEMITVGASLPAYLRSRRCNGEYPLAGNMQTKGSLCT
jgi:hypothetical protein